MQKWIVFLSGLLTVQLLLALGLTLADKDDGAFEPQRKLLAFDKQTVDGLRLADSESSVILSKRDDRWVLPENGDFPADQGAVDRLLDKLAGLERGWPVAITAGAVKRFKVDDAAFERKLTLLTQDEPQAVLYVGTSPGLRKVHVRPVGEDQVYAVAFATWEANARVDDWIDKDILRLDTAEVERVEMPGFVLQRDGEQLRIMDLTDQEETNGREVGSLVNKLADLAIQSLLGAEAQPWFRQDAPVLEFKVTRKAGDVLTYRLSKPADEAYYVLKRSDLEHYFKVAEFTVRPILETRREQLITTQ